MEFRKLKSGEHGRTRALYESVFPEDDKAFVDYYYQWKTKDNVIYVAEDAAGIHAMVQLNPFLVAVRGRVSRMHYIVAVATQKEYRHQGLMRRLLELAEQDMQEAGEEFTFLMPASEQIYLPFGYRFFCSQRRGILRGLESRERGASGQEGYCRPLHRREYQALAGFVNRVLESECEMFIYRDEAYYERLQAEQRCQDGDVMVICRACADSSAARNEGRIDPEACDRRETQTEIIGTFCMATEHLADGNRTVLREIIIERKHFSWALSILQEFAGRYGGCQVSGCIPELPLEQEQTMPLLMGKVPGGGPLCGEFDQGFVFINEVV